MAAGVFAFYLLLFRLAPAGNPVLSFDSTGYLATARWLAGVEPVPKQLGAYTAFGYSLPLTLPYLIVDDATTVYRSAVVLNALLGAALVLPLRMLVSELLFLAPRPALVAAVAGSIYAGVALQVGQVWPEIALAVALACWTLFLARHTSSPGARETLSLAGLALILFALHHRMIVVLLVTVVAILVSRAPGRLRLGATTGVAVAALAVLALDRVIQHAIYPVVTNYSSIGALDYGALDELVTAITGQLWYLLAASAGLALVGALGFARGPIRTGVPRTRFSLLFASALGGTLLLTSLQIAGNWQASGQLAHFVMYGRYIDPFLPVLVTTGTGILLASAVQRQSLLAPVLLMIFSGAIALAHGVEIAGGPQKLNVLGILGAISLFEPRAAMGSSVEFARVAATIAAVSIAVVTTAYLGFRRVATGLFLLVLVAASVVGAARSLQPYQAHWELLDTQMATAIESYPRSVPVSFLGGGLDPGSFNRLQLFAPDRVFLLRDRPDQLPHGLSLVVARKDWSGAAGVEHKRVLVDAARPEVALFEVSAARRPAPRQ